MKMRQLYKIQIGNTANTNNIFALFVLIPGQKKHVLRITDRPDIPGRLFLKTRKILSVTAG